VVKFTTCRSVEVSSDNLGVSEVSGFETVSSWLEKDCSGS